MKLDRIKYILAKEIISGRTPESALSSDLVEAVITTQIVGSGESASWKQNAVIRLNGKQIWRGAKYDFEQDGLEKILGRPTKEFGRIRNSVLYYCLDNCPADANMAS